MGSLFKRVALYERVVGCFARVGLKGFRTRGFR